MRFALASIALLAFAHSLPSGVHGAPAVVSDHANLLATRQDPASLVGIILGLVNGILGAAPISPQLVEKLTEQIAQELQVRAASGMLPRAPSSSDSTYSTSSSVLSSTTTSSVFPVATDQIGTSTGVSLSTPQGSSTPLARMRRQVPSGLPTSVLSAVLSILGSQSVSLPVPSAPASTPPAVPSTRGVTSPSAASQPTPSNPSQV